MVEIAKESPVLIAQAGPLKGQRFFIDRVCMIGREPDCRIHIPDRQVSRYHARITPTNTGIEIEDLGSKNGTHLNGSRISKSELLQDGDLVQVALIQQFAFLTTDATIPLIGSNDLDRVLTLDLRSRGVKVNDKTIDPPLSALQFLVLTVLYKNQGDIITRQDLVSEAWGSEAASGVSDEALDALLRRLRDRIATVDSEHTYIVTIRGHGIRLDNPMK